MVSIVHKNSPYNHRKSNIFWGGAKRITLLKLHEHTPRNIVENSTKAGCGFRYIGTVTKPNGLCTFAYKTGCSGREHITTFEVLPAIGDVKLHPIRVQCSCEYFVFTLEVVMAARGLSENRLALPQWPVIRNPSGAKFLCKHLYMTANDFMNKARRAFTSPESGIDMKRPELEHEIEKSFRTTRDQAKDPQFRRANKHL